MTDACVWRLLPLTCLAPDIVEAILDGRQPKGLRLAEVLGKAGERAACMERPEGDLGLQQFTPTCLGRFGLGAAQFVEADRLNLLGLCTEAAVLAGDLGWQGLAEAVEELA